MRRRPRRHGNREDASSSSMITECAATRSSDTLYAIRIAKTVVKPVRKKVCTLLYGLSSRTVRSSKRLCKKLHHLFSLFILQRRWPLPIWLNALFRHKILKHFLEILTLPLSTPSASSQCPYFKILDPLLCRDATTHAVFLWWYYGQILICVLQFHLCILLRDELQMMLYNLVLRVRKAEVNWLTNWLVDKMKFHWLMRRRKLNRRAERNVAKMKICHLAEYTN